jgi:hypothetical protein
MDVKKVSRFKYATWTVRRPAGKEEELDKILNERVKYSTVCYSESPETWRVYASK